MATLVLIRHARTAETGSLLSGRREGIPLSPTGRSEAKLLAERLAGVRFAGIFSSPMQRCRETVEAIRSTRGPNVPARPNTQIEDRLTEVDYGGWTGKELKVLAKDPLWTTVQRQPSAMQFPEGESLRAAATRATEAIRDLDAGFKDEDVWLAVSHGDIIKAMDPRKRRNVMILLMAYVFCIIVNFYSIKVKQDAGDVYLMNKQVELFTFIDRDAFNNTMYSQI